MTRPCRWCYNAIVYKGEIGSRDGCRMKGRLPGGQETWIDIVSAGVRDNCSVPLLYRRLSMKRQWKIVLCLLAVLVALNGCSPDPQQGGAPQFEEVTQDLAPTAVPPTPTPETAASGQNRTGGESVFAANPYEVQGIDEFTSEDALLEEGYVDAGDSIGEADPYTDYSYVDPNATPYIYAGSTPIPLDPLDMPTPTPRPEIVFTYGPYSAATLGLFFEGPVGWLPNESNTEEFQLIEPDVQVKDGQPGIIRLRAVPVANDYTENDLKAYIIQQLKDIGAVGYEVWEPSLTASRYLMGARGVYANYTGTLVSGVRVGGRIHAATIDSVLYTAEITYPLGFRTAYVDAFTKLRDTIKRQ